MNLQYEKNDALFMAIWSEHKRCTGHDIDDCRESGALKHPECDTCISLHRYKNAIYTEIEAERKAQRPKKGDNWMFQIELSRNHISAFMEAVRLCANSMENQILEDDMNLLLEIVDKIEAARKKE